MLADIKGAGFEVTFKTLGRRKIQLGLGLVIAVVMAAYVINPASSDDSSEWISSETRCVTPAKTLAAAKAAYAETCSAPRIDCDPRGGMWYCSSEQIGTNSPGGPRPSSTPPAAAEAPRSPAQPASSGSLISAEEEEAIFLEVMRQLTDEDRATFVAQVQQLTTDERQQLAVSLRNQLIEQQQAAAAAPTPEPAAPAPAPAEQAARVESAPVALTAAQQNQIFAASLAGLSPELQDAYMAEFQSLTPDQRLQLTTQMIS